MLAGFLFFYLATSWVSSVYVGILCGTYTLPLYHFLNSEDARTLSSTRLLMTGAIIGLVSTDGRFFVWLLGYVMGILVDVVHTQYDLIKEEKSILATVIHNDDDDDDDDDTIDEFSESEDDDAIDEFSESEDEDTIDEFSESEDDVDVPVLEQNVSLPVPDEKVPTLNEAVDSIPENMLENIPDKVSYTIPVDVNDYVVTEAPQ
jgi:hypothetical protein